MKSTHIISIALILASLLFIAFFLAFPNRIIMKNSSQSTITDVNIKLMNVDGSWSKNKTIPSINTDTRVTIRHGQNDLRAEIHYVFEGKELNYQEVYIDLWRGEGWIFDIQPDGSIKAGHERKR